MRCVVIDTEFLEFRQLVQYWFFARGALFIMENLARVLETAKKVLM